MQKNWRVGYAGNHLTDKHGQTLIAIPRMEYFPHQGFRVSKENWRVRYFYVARLVSCTARTAKKRHPAKISLGNADIARLHQELSGEIHLLQEISLVILQVENFPFPPHKLH